MNKSKIKSSQEIASDLQLAKYSLSPEGNPTNDEAMINAAAYHTQQATEKLLKFYLRDVYGEDENKKSFWTHNIATLIERLEEHGMEIDDTIKDYSEDLTNWEAGSRYGHSLVADKLEIQEVIEKIEGMLGNVKAIE